MVAKDILVDGYNVIKNNAAFKFVEAKSLAASREALITQMVSKYRHTPHRVTIVFDGDGDYEQKVTDRRIGIIYSKRGETADSVIARLTALWRVESREVEMYSDDGEVRFAVTSEGGQAYRTKTLTTYLNAPSQDVALKYQYRQKARRDYGLDPSCKIEDDLDDQSPKGKKKSPRRRK